MFNWNPTSTNRKFTYEELCERVHDCNVKHTAAYNDLKVSLERDRADLWKAVKDLSEAASKPAPAPNLTALEQRMAVLETWRAQLHTLLVERGNTGKEKLSRTGNSLAKFYGRG